MDKNSQSICFPTAPFPYLSTGGTPIGGQLTVVNKKAKSSWDNVEKVRGLAFWDYCYQSVFKYDQLKYIGKMLKYVGQKGN